MTNDRTPYFATKLECPVCGYLNSFEILKQGSYTESGKDTDFAPTGRVWKNPSFQGYNPLLYFTGSCRNCYYTREMNSAFREWQEDKGFRTYRLPNQKKRHLKEIASDDSVIKVLGENIDYRNFPNESAIIKLLIAIYDELLLERPTSLDVARYYLRIAWIYREMAGGRGETISLAQITVNNIQYEISRLKDYMEGLGNLIGPLANIVISDLKPLVSRDQSSGNLTSGMEEGFENIGKLGSEIWENVNRIESEFNSVKEEISGYKPEGKGQDDFAGYPTFKDFLSEIQEKWRDIPLNEIESLDLSLRYYIKAYQNSKEIKAGLQQLQASYMIGELSRRVGNNIQAMEYFKNASKQAHEMMHRNRNDKTIFANAQKILELCLEQARLLKKTDRVKT
ncbi:MAG: DUF2225 domain-containing protein [Candidatus Zixiibacteriota bacterium]|nr:MAG: DUF2225 domain-containing protein [candidate division Zixibacteria bacterium]